MACSMSPSVRKNVGLTPSEERQCDDLRTERRALDARVLALATRAQRTVSDRAEKERLLERRQQLEGSLAKLAAVVSSGQVAALGQIQAVLPADAAFLTWIDVSDMSGGVQEHWGCVVRSMGNPQWERLPGSGPGEKWTKEDTAMPAQLREALVRSAAADQIETVAKRLHAQRLAPLEKHLAGVKRLVVAPVRQMAGIPIEALTDRYTISYTPSGTYLARLKDRERPHSLQLLAVGDPVFPAAKVAMPSAALPPGGLLITQVVPGGNASTARLQAGDVLVTYAGEDLTSVAQLGKLVAAQADAKAVIVKVWREGQEKERELAPGKLGVVLAKEPAREAIPGRRQTDQMLAKLRGGEEFAELPGTEVEVARLAALFEPKAVTVLTRSDASEQRLDEIRKEGQLKKFRYLHFATHGEANNVRAFDSALMLTTPAKLPEPRVGEPYLDGRLTADEVLEYWKLDADLVTLSACESGLGRQGGGDGLLGFAQAFLLAGSRSVCLSLWQVDDTATALLMDRFYRNLLGKREDGAERMGKAAALREAKHWLRNLTAGEALQRLGTLTQGVVRGKRPAREVMKSPPQAKGRHRRLQALCPPALLGRLHPHRRPGVKSEMTHRLPLEFSMSRSLWIASVLCGFGVGMARSENPKPKTEPKPLWQCVLKGDDAKKAAELEKRIEELEAADSYESALSVAAELLTLRTQVQGGDHWETRSQKWALIRLKKVAALPEDKRSAWRKVVQADSEAYRLERRTQYAKSLPLRRERLEWCRKVLGEHHPDTGMAYAELGFNLNAQANYTEAGPLLQKSLDIRRQAFGELHPDTALSYNNFAWNLHSQGSYTEAAPLFQKALDIYRTVLGEFDQNTASCYNNVAKNLNAQGRYAEAGPLVQNALDIRRKVLGENDPNTGASYSNVAMNLHKQGKYAEAGPLHWKGMEIIRKTLGEDQPYTATSYQNVAVNSGTQGKYAEAAPLKRRALDIRRKVLGKKHPETASSYHAVAINLNAQGKYGEAQPYCQKALDIDLEVLGEFHPETARMYYSLAANFRLQKKYGEAGLYYQRSLDIRRKVLGEEHPATAVSYGGVAANLQAQSRSEEAEPLLQKALTINRKVLGEEHPETTISYGNLAVNLHSLGMAEQELAKLEAAARSYEAARLRVASSGLERAAFGAERSPYGFLAAARSRAGRPVNAWDSLEANLARGLLDESATRRGIGLTQSEQRRRDDLAAALISLDTRILALVGRAERTAAQTMELDHLVAERGKLEQSLGDLAAAVSRREVTALTQVQATISSNAALIAWVDARDITGHVQEHWGCVVRSNEKPTWEQLPGSGPNGKWTNDDEDLPARFRDALIGSAPIAELNALANKLYVQHIGPLGKHLNGVKHLFVAGIRQMAGIPIEALTDQYTSATRPREPSSHAQGPGTLHTAPTARRRRPRVPVRRRMCQFPPTFHPAACSSPRWSPKAMLPRRA